MPCNPELVNLQNVDLSSANIRTFKMLAEIENQRVLEQYKYISLKYGPNGEEKVEVYYKDTSVATPIVVYIHYGGGSGLTKDSATFHVAPVVEKGYRAMVANLDYLANAASQAEKQEQIKKVRAFILKYARKTFAKHVCLLSSMSGAHLLLAMLDKSLADENDADIILNVGFVSGNFSPYIASPKYGILESNEMYDLLSMDFSHLKRLPIEIDIYSTDTDSTGDCARLRCELRRVGVGGEYVVYENMEDFQVVHNLNRPDFPPMQRILKKLEKKHMLGYS